MLDARLEAMSIPASRISVFASGKSVMAVAIQVAAHGILHALPNRRHCGLPSIEMQPKDESPISVAPWALSVIDDMQISILSFIP